MKYLASILVLASITLSCFVEGMPAARAEDGLNLNSCGIVRYDAPRTGEEPVIVGRLSAREFRRYRELLADDSLTRTQLETLEQEIGEYGDHMLAAEPGRRRDVSPLMIGLADQFLRHGSTSKAVNIYAAVYLSLIEVDERTILMLEALEKIARVLLANDATACASDVVRHTVELLEEWHDTCFLPDNAYANYLKVQKDLLIELDLRDEAAKVEDAAHAAERRATSGNYHCPNVLELDGGGTQLQS